MLKLSLLYHYYLQPLVKWTTYLYNLHNLKCRMFTKENPDYNDENTFTYIVNKNTQKYTA